MEFMNYLQENKKRHLAEAAELAAADRRDDAVFAKIRANVFDIFLQVGDKSHKIFEHLKIKWANEKALAEEHGDTAAAAIEQIKLEMLYEIEKELKANG